MRVLFDQGTPVPLRRLLSPHEVSTAYELGWSTLRNGELLLAAEVEGFEVMVTTDKNLKYQQNLASRRISIVVLSTTSWPRIRVASEAIVAAVSGAVLGSYIEIEVARAGALPRVRADSLHLAVPGPHFILGLPHPNEVSRSTQR